MNANEKRWINAIEAWDDPDVLVSLGADGGELAEYGAEAGDVEGEWFIDLLSLARYVLDTHEEHEEYARELGG